MWRFFAWLWCWRSKVGFSWKMSVLERKIDLLRIETSQKEKKLERSKDALEDRAERFEKELRETQKQIYNLNLHNQKLEEGLESAREQLKTANQITIPGLVAAHDVLLKRWQAESTILSMRQIASSKEE